MVSASEIPWDELLSGYRLPYDPRPALRVVVAGSGDWDALWQDLYHQGDVDTASYVAVSLIADLAENGFADDWNTYALPLSIEEARRESRNPPVPEWALEGYQAGWERLFAVGLSTFPTATDELLTTSILALFAAYKRLPMLARLAILSEDERKDILDSLGWA